MNNLNLITDPFIRVLDHTGNETEISITEALLHAQDFQAIAGDCLPQDIAIERLLLGILHRVLQNYDADGNEEEITDADQAVSRWIEIWQNGKFPQEAIQKYLEAYKAYFNLIDPDRPFMQAHETEDHIEFKTVSGKIAKGKGINPRSISKLVGTVFASESRPRVWADRYYSENSTLSLPEAARWLLFINSYDDASFKSPSTDIHVAFCGQITGIYAEGANLFETLMLNLPLCRSDGNLWPVNRPYWELEPYHRSKMVVTPPDNPSLLLTFPYRRMHLRFDDEGNVTGYELTGHHSFSTADYATEQNGVYRNPDEKKGIPRGFRRLSTDWMWQNYSDLFIEADDNNRPGVIDWLNGIITEGVEIPQLKFRSVTVSYKSIQCVFAEMTDDSLIMNGSLLRENSLEWRQNIGMIVTRIKKCAFLTGLFYKNLAIAGGFDPKKEYPMKKGEEVFWNKIDLPFRKWLSGIESISDIIEKDTEICKEVYEIAQQIAREKEATCDLKTAIGRTLKEKKGSKEIEVEYNFQKVRGQYLKAVKNAMEGKEVDGKPKK